MERTPFTSEADEANDAREGFSTKQRSPLEVMRDWWADRQRMLFEREEDEEDDNSVEGTKKRRISKALRGLFGKNVEKHEVGPTSDPRVPEQRILGGVVELADVSPEEPAPHNTGTEAVPTLHAPDHTTAEKTTTITPEAPDYEEDDERSRVVTPPLPIRLEAPSPEEPAEPEAGAEDRREPRSPVAPEARRTVEYHEHHHRRAALGALIIAERIDHHRNKKRKAQIGKLEKAQKEYRKHTDTRLEAVEVANATTEKRPQPAPLERPLATPEPRKSDRPERPSEMSRPQSVKEVLKHKEHQRTERPSLADLERKRSHTAIEQPRKEEDIITTAERLATHANENIAHEVYDERWHEIKDQDDTESQSMQSGSAQRPSAPVNPLTVPIPTANPGQTADTSAMVNPSQMTTQSTHVNRSMVGIWTALVIGVLVALGLILL